MICIPFEDVVFSIKKQLAGWSSLLSAGAWNVSGRLQYNTAAHTTPSLPTLIAPTNLNEMCCCVDSRGRWPLSRSKHLSEIGWNWYNPGRGIITPAWDLLCHVANFIRPGRALLMFLWQPHSFFFFFFRHHLIYSASLVDVDRLPPETELSLWGGLWRRLIRESHWRSALSVVTCARECAYVPTHTTRGHHIRL